MIARNNINTRAGPCIRRAVPQPGTAQAARLRPSPITPLFAGKRNPLYIGPHNAGTDKLPINFPVRPQAPVISSVHRRGFGSRSAVNLLYPNLVRCDLVDQTEASEQLLKARVRAQVILSGVHKNVCHKVGAFLISLLDQVEGAVFFSERRMDSRLQKG